MMFVPAKPCRALGAVAYISGVGFWDFAHGQHGHASNYAELHPVTGLGLIADCSRVGLDGAGQAARFDRTAADRERITATEEHG
jgi:hypothetical protein